METLSILVNFPISASDDFHLLWKLGDAEACNLLLARLARFFGHLIFQGGRSGESQHKRPHAALPPLTIPDGGLADTAPDVDEGHAVRCEEALRLLRVEP